MKKGSNKGERTLEINLTTLIALVSLVIMLVLAILASISVIKSFARVSKIEVFGDSPYEREEIVNASGIRAKDKLYSIDKEEAERSIKAYCPYVDKVTIESKFPNTVKITVESKAASWYVEIYGDYYALDEDLRVLEETSNKDKFTALKVPQLTLPNIKNAVVGSALEFGKSEQEKKSADEFMSAIQMTTFKSRLTLVDIEERFNITLVVDGNIAVYVGSITDADIKLAALEKALSNTSLEGYSRAEIDVSDPRNVFVRPIYD
ncbi:MAG: FtsQ-type POTRA domain-containing protein [Clostridia bacterium]|nr:FtsQ-type POTRA domain-containing protein [Clostridia bacterium]